MKQVIQIFLSLLAILSVASSSFTCTTLNNLNLDNGSYYDDKCECTTEGSVTTDSCESTCIGATDGSYFGDATSVSSIDEVPNVTPDTHKTTITQCIKYDDDTYDGATVCYETYQDSLGINSVCVITVDDVPCYVCQRQNAGAFTENTLQFDCSDLTYGPNNTKFEAVVDVTNFNEAIDGTLLRFLNGAVASDKCPSDAGGKSGGGTASIISVFTLSVGLMVGIFL